MDINLIKLDETKDYSSDIQARVKSIWGAYFYNPERMVYLCEMTPSFELHRLPSIVFGVDGRDVEALEEEIHLAEAGETEVSYIHCYRIGIAEVLEGFGAGFEFDSELKLSESEQLNDYLIAEATEYFSQNGY